MPISKRPDSHPPSLYETKAGLLMKLEDEPGSAVHVNDRHAASVRDTMNVFLPIKDV